MTTYNLIQEGQIVAVVLLVSFIGICYLVYPIFLTMNNLKFPQGCLKYYPENVTLNNGQAIYTRFWNDKCCSITIVPARHLNMCWNKETVNTK